MMKFGGPLDGKGPPCGFLSSALKINGPLGSCLACLMGNPALSVIRRGEKGEKQYKAAGIGATRSSHQ